MLEFLIDLPLILQTTSQALLILFVSLRGITVAMTRDAFRTLSGQRLFAWMHARRGVQPQRVFLTITDQATNKPLSHVEVIIRKHGKTLARAFSGRDGRVYFPQAMLAGKSRMLRIVKKGYHAWEEALEDDLADVALQPIGTGLAKTKVPARAAFVLLQLSRTSSMVILVAGSVAAVGALLLAPSLLSLLVICFYLAGWLWIVRSRPTHFHTAQIVNSQSQAPVSFAYITLYRKHRVEHLIADQHGTIRIGYPLPYCYSVHHSAYKPVVQQGLSAMMVSDDTVLLPLDPYARSPA